MSRWAPTVVPVLPPTGAAGVVSLKPTPGALPFTIVIFAPPARSAAGARTTARAAIAAGRILARITRFMRMASLLLERRRARGLRRGGGRRPAARGEGSVGVPDDRDALHELALQVHDDHAVGIDHHLGDFGGVGRLGARAGGESPLLLGRSLAQLARRGIDERPETALSGRFLGRTLRSDGGRRLGHRLPGLLRT